jgi:peptidoglycan/LPS O-acetylase OafA/YrhL
MFYACFPLLAVLLRSFGALAFAAVGAIVVAWSYSAHSVEAATDAARFNAYVLMPNHAFAFLLGGIIAKLRAGTTARVPFALTCAVLCAAACLWILSQPRVFDHFDVVLGASRAYYVAAAVGCVSLAVITQVRTGWLQALLEQLGELSYPVYLLHPLAWAACSAWLPSTTPAVAQVCAALLLTLLFSALAARCYERPLRKALRARWLGRRAATSVPFATR